MDWRKRCYYVVSFSSESHFYRFEILKRIKKVKFHPFKELGMQKDESELRGNYQCMVSVLKEDSEVIEYELRKAFRNDFGSRWKKIEPAV